MVTYDHKIQFVTLYTETLDFNVVFAKKNISVHISNEEDAVWITAFPYGQNIPL